MGLSVALIVLYVPSGQNLALTVLYFPQRGQNLALTVLYALERGQNLTLTVLYVPHCGCAAAVVDWAHPLRAHGLETRIIYKLGPRTFTKQDDLY